MKAKAKRRLRERIAATILAALLGIDIAVSLMGGGNFIGVVPKIVRMADYVVTAVNGAPIDTLGVDSLSLEGDTCLTK